MGKSQSISPTPIRSQRSSMITQSESLRKARSTLATKTVSPFFTRAHSSFPAARSVSGTLPLTASFQEPSSFCTGASWNQPSIRRPRRLAAWSIVWRCPSGDNACLSVETRT